MIYFLYGNEHEKARLKARELTETLQKKKPDAVFFRINALNFKDNSLDGLVSGQGLFESKYIVFFDNLFESKEVKEMVVGYIKEITASDNVFIFLEKEVDKKTLTIFEKYSTKIQAFESEKEKKKSDYNPFALSDAFNSKDKKKTWALLLEAKRRGGAPEEVHGLLWWQVKTLATVSKTKDDAEALLLSGQAGISPFVFTKSKQALRFYTESEINTMLFNLVTMYHEAHRGTVDLWNEMEKWILRL